MQPKGPTTTRRAGAPSDDEHRVRLLLTLAGSLAQLGLVEEAAEACRAVARLRAGGAPVQS